MDGIGPTRRRCDAQFVSGRLAGESAMQTGAGARAVAAISRVCRRDARDARRARRPYEAGRGRGDQSDPAGVDFGLTCGVENGDGRISASCRDVELEAVDRGLFCKTETVVMVMKLRQIRRL